MSKIVYVVVIGLFDHFNTQSLIVPLFTYFFKNPNECLKFRNDLVNWPGLDEVFNSDGMKNVIDCASKEFDMPLDLKVDWFTGTPEEVIDTLYFEW